MSKKKVQEKSPSPSTKRKQILADDNSRPPRRERSSHHRGWAKNDSWAAVLGGCLTPPPANYRAGN